MTQTLLNLGAGGFGIMIGWLVYYINRYRKSEVQFSDLTTLIGIIGGGSVTALFDKEGGAFGAYGIGLFIGFFGYFLALTRFVKMSEGEFTWTWFLDGRCKPPQNGFQIPGGPRPQIPMAAPSSVADGPVVAALHDVREGLAMLAYDVRAAVPQDNEQVISSCNVAWEANKGDCNKFVLAVAGSLGIGGLEAPADAIVSTILSSADWRELDSGAEAAAAAAKGEFVIGGLKGADHDPARNHGHVVVVVKGPVASGKYPSAYWGSLGAKPGKNETVNFSWNSKDRDKVKYAARKIP